MSEVLDRYNASIVPQHERNAVMRYFVEIIKPILELNLGKEIFNPSFMMSHDFMAILRCYDRMHFNADYSGEMRDVLSHLLLLATTNPRRIGGTRLAKFLIKKELMSTIQTKMMVHLDHYIMLQNLKTKEHATY